MAAMTLEEIKKGMADKVFGQIVDIFLRQSAILSVLPFDDCVSASGGGSTMKYKYLRKVLPATAQFRKIGGSYTASAATKQECEASLAIMGGSVQMDRVLNKAAGNWDNLAYQIEEHIKAVVSLFHYTLINGDATTTAETDHPEFEGLDSMLAGTSTEFGAGSSIDLSTITNLKNNADEFYEALNLLIQTTDADALLMNTDMITKVQDSGPGVGLQNRDRGSLWPPGHQRGRGAIYGSAEPLHRLRFHRNRRPGGAQGHQPHHFRQLRYHRAYRHLRGEV